MRIFFLANVSGVLLVSSFFRHLQWFYFSVLLFGTLLWRLIIASFVQLKFAKHVIWFILLCCTVTVLLNCGFFTRALIVVSTLILVLC